jgi:solute:Na+ symporter, SSS family
MELIDWLIVIIPVTFVIGMGFYSRKYIRGIADFLAAGRVCGRYVICVGDVAQMLSIIGLVAYVEVHYKTGFALAFWQLIMSPLGIVMGLFGYCTYRFRETKAMSLGQFLEMRYNRKFRIFASALRSLSEMLANMIMLELEMLQIFINLL